MAREVEKRVKNAILYKDGTIRVDNVRFSHPHVFEQGRDKDTGKPNGFSLQGFLPKATHKEAKKLIMECIEATEAEAKLTGKVAKDKRFLRDGDGSGKPEAAGCYTISTREKKRPSVRGKDGRPLDPEKDADVIYGGCYGNILLRPWCQNNTYGKRTNANLISCQFVKDGEPFGEGRLSEDDIDDTWDNLDDDDDNGGFDDDDMDGL